MKQRRTRSVALVAIVAFVFLRLAIDSAAHTPPVSFLRLVPDADCLHLELTFKPFALTLFPELDANKDGRVGPRATRPFRSDTRAPVMAYPFVSSFSAKVGGENRPLPAASGSCLTLDAPNPQIVPLKAAEDEDGYILRFREIAGRAGAAGIQLPTLRLKEAHLCNGVEVNQRKLSVTGSTVKVPCKPNQYVTVRLKAGGDLQKLA